MNSSIKHNVLSVIKWRKLRHPAHDIFLGYFSSGHKKSEKKKTYKSLLHKAPQSGL